MRKLAILCLASAAIALAACGTLSGTAQETAVKTAITGCGAYATTLSALAGYRAAGLLSTAQVATVESLRGNLNAICDGPYPTDPGAAQVELTNGLTALNTIVAQVKK